jgi:Flp pilus assembly protein TadG
MFKAFRKLKLKERLKRFASNTHGNVTLMAGISAIPLVIAGGAAIDYERAINAKTQLQASLDSAVLYASAQNSTSNDVLTSVSRPYLDSNYHNNADAKVKSFAITAGDATNTLKATGVVTLNTWFMATVGIYTLDVTANSQALHTGTGRNINLEVSMVLDNTNSMNTPGSGYATKPIDDLKTAATNFVNTVMSSNQTPYYTKIAVIPYNNGVNLGSAAAATAARGTYLAGTNIVPGWQKYTFPNASGGSSTFTISNCVTERVGPLAYTDASAATSPVGRQYDGTQNICGVQQYLPLSTSVTSINSTINAMVANYSTAGQVGIAWGWYTLSPNFGIFSGESVPAGYDKLTTTDTASKVKKVMILMTDGEYNSVYSNGVISGNPVVSGSYYTTDDLINRAPDNGNVYTQSNSMCTAIKASGVEVYTIAFQLDQSYPQRVALLSNCATDASHALNAANQSQLNSVFQTLALNLVAMRLTK